MSFLHLCVIFILLQHRWHRAGALATGCKIDVKLVHSSMDLRQNKALGEHLNSPSLRPLTSIHIWRFNCLLCLLWNKGDEFAHVFGSKYGSIDRKYGIAGASTDFVSHSFLWPLSPSCKTFHLSRLSSLWSPLPRTISCDPITTLYSYLFVHVASSFSPRALNSKSKTDSPSYFASRLPCRATSHTVRFISTVKLSQNLSPPSSHLFGGYLGGSYGLLILYVTFLHGN